MKNLIYRIFQNIGLLITSFGLLYGGIAIFNTDIPFWSLVYGIPAVSLGIVLSLITFNEVAKNSTAKSTEYHLILCKVCHKETLAPMLIESIVCPNCQYKMAVKLNLAAFSFFLIIAIPITFHLVLQKQDIRQQAKDHLPTRCETGKWQPEICQCGLWKQNRNCKQEESERICDGELYCCILKNNLDWDCSAKKNPDYKNLF